MKKNLICTTVCLLFTWIQFNAAGADLMVKGVRFFYPHKDSAQVFTLHTTSHFISLRKNPDEDMFIHFELGIEVKDEEGNSLYQATEQYRSTSIGDRDIPMGIKFPLKTGNYDIVVSVKDMNSSNVQKFRYPLHRKPGFNPENILPINASNQKIIYFNYTYANSLSLYAPLHTNEELILKKFETSYFISPPPFNKSTGKMNFSQPETVDAIVFDSTGNATFTSREDGTHTISRSNDLRPSFMMLHFAQDFPDIETVRSIAPPMRYISSTKEYNTILDAPTTLKQRSQFEKFWLTCTKGSKSRARNLIRNYFNRVEHANKFFTSYKEGWKTDKGMIYIVFGKPDFIETEKGTQIWIYGNKSRINSLVFYFERVEGSVSPNDYVMERRPDYKTPWYIAIESWRSGKTYQFN